MLEKEEKGSKESKAHDIGTKEKGTKLGKKGVPPKEREV